jgi:biotin-dependent carboxylase-like uncharacterized protein
MLEVLRVGGLTTVQDHGRPGLAHLGVPPSGALDRPALDLANRIVGNPLGTAGLEITLGGLVLRAAVPLTVALTGAPGPVRVGSRPAPLGTAVVLPAGSLLTIGYAESGLRRYLAVAGGVAVPPVLGSRSTDTLSGLGPPSLRQGDRLAVGSPAGPPSSVDFSGVAAIPGELIVGVRFGPRDAWFTDPTQLLRHAYQVSPMSDRVGARLTGPALSRADLGELPSEPVVTGAIQVPADGRPLVFLADHPTTGGYPVIAVVDAKEVPRLAQARPGTSVRFRESRG